MRVLVADDHSIVRMALKHVLLDLDPAAQVHEAATGEDALRILREERFDLVILDLYMPKADETLVPQAVEMAGGAPVVVFTVSEHPRHAQSALAAGAKGFIPKTTEDGLIVNILRLVLAGGVYLPPSVTLNGGQQDGPRASLGALGGSPGGANGDERSLPPLTPRQLQVLELLAEGLSNAEISERMGLNLSTVKSHVTGVLRALNVGSRTQAVLAFKQSEWTSYP